MSDTRFVVLLRGINVGGKNKVPMAELRDTLNGTGFADVVTYIQSGNVILDGRARNEQQVIDDVAGAIADDFGLDIPVVARPVEAWSAIMTANPFPEGESEPKFLHVYFCDTAPSDEALNGFDPSPYEPDLFQAVGRELYVWYANGASRSKLTGAVLERKLGVTATARNWSTVLKLAELIESVQTG